MGRVFKPRRKLSNGSIWTSPKWYIEYRDAGGVQYRKPASTSKTEALGLLKEVEGAERRRALVIDPAPIPASKVNTPGHGHKGTELKETEVRTRLTFRNAVWQIVDSKFDTVTGEGTEGNESPN